MSHAYYYPHSNYPMQAGGAGPGCPLVFKLSPHKKARLTKPSTGKCGTMTPPLKKIGHSQDNHFFSQNLFCSYKHGPVPVIGWLKNNKTRQQPHAENVQPEHTFPSTLRTRFPVVVPCSNSIRWILSLKATSHTATRSSPIAL